jgi:hypothetical protein
MVRYLNRFAVCFSSVVVLVVYIFCLVEQKARLPKGIGRPAACLAYLNYLGTNGPNMSGCRCLVTRGSEAAMASTSPLHQMRAGTCARYRSRTEGVASALK